MKTTRNHASGGAFTLVEIMIAIAILAMVLVSIFASWNAILQGSRAGQKVAAEVHRNRMSLNALQTAFFCVQMFGANIRHYPFITDTSSDFAYLSLVSRLPASFPGSGLFGDQVVRRVTFFVEPGTNWQNQLVLQQKPLLEATNQDEQPYTIVLARDVSLFTLEFWGPQSREWETEWPYTNQLPKMVRITLGIGNQGSRYMPRPDEILTRVVGIPGMTVPAQVQVPTGPGAPGVGPGGVGTPGGTNRFRGQPGGIDPRTGRSNPSFTPGGPGGPGIVPFPPRGAPRGGR